MKIVISRKNTIPAVPGETGLVNALNSGFGNIVKVMADDEVEDYIKAQAIRGHVCYSFDHVGTYHAHTTVVKAA